VETREIGSVRGIKSPREQLDKTRGESKCQIQKATANLRVLKILAVSRKINLDWL